MYIYYCISFFVIGIYLGTLFNIIGYGFPKKEVIIYSFTDEDNNYLSWLLLPIINYFILKYKYHKNISIFNSLIELISGLLFLISYIHYGLTLQFLLSLTFISMLVIIVVSDYHYMIICDEILIVFGLLLLIELYFIGGISYLLNCLFNGLISFIVMFLIKKLGDFLFKRESMGGGDIKLLFIFGLVLGLPLALSSIFLGSIIALPISLIILKNDLNHEIPFGPFLSMAAIILLFFGDSMIIELINILS